MISRASGWMLAAFAILAAPSASAFPAQLESRPVPVQNEVVNDLGFADFDGDGDADIYSANHSNPSTFLRNDGGWAFTDVESSLGLAQSPAAPSWNELSVAPAMADPGLYIWAGWETIDIRASDSAQPASGSLRLYSPVEASTGGGAQVEIVQEPGNPPPTQARFTVPAGGSATLRYTRAGHSFVPTTLEVDPSYPLERVHLGADAETPASRTVELNLRDRHAMVWGQFDADQRPDVLIVRGGLKRSVYAIDRRPTDELFVAGETGFTDRAVGLGLGSQVCSGREARQVDVGSGKAADVLVACRSAYPRVYKRDLFGFSKRADKFPRQMKSASWYLPFDLGRGTGRTFLIRRESRVHVVKVRGRKWKVIQTIRLRSQERSDRNHKRVALGDIDGDSDMDAYIPDPDGSTLLVNKRGRLVALSSKRRGLPHASRAAAMVDYDLDGRLDLHLMPQGIFRQVKKNRFAAEDEADALGTPVAGDVSISWADLDGDLDLDALIGEQPFDGGHWDVRALENVGETGNAIGVHAEGRIENAVAMGARVVVLSRGRRQHGWIGQNNTNSFGQGNYDLVFGIGNAERASRVAIVWPDGTKTVRRDVYAGNTAVMRQK